MTSPYLSNEMTDAQFEQFKLSRVLAFRRECHAQRVPATDAEIIELERRLDAVRKAMSPEIHTDEQLPGCWVATDRNSYDWVATDRNSYDWVATDRNSYDGPDSPIGSGSTEQEAIDDLLDQLEDE